MTALDTTWVRAQFPAFSDPALTGQAFFDNAGGSYPCRQVIDRLMRFYMQRKMQPYAPNPVSQLAGAEMDEARVRLAAMLGVATHELSFGPSTSTNTYVLANAVRRWLQPGQAIVVTNQDHEANSGFWRRLAEEGVEVREWRLDPETGSLQLDDLAQLLDETVKLVCFPHCSNVIADINDVKTITAMAHAVGAYTCVDGVSYAPHGLPDVGDMGCDVYLFSAYKTYGPHQGIMAIRESFGAQLPNQAHYFNAGTLYKKLTPSGPDHAQIAACAGMADYFEALSVHHGGPTGPKAAAYSHDLMRNQEVALLQPLLDYLGDKNSVRLLGSRRAADRAPTVAVELAGDGHTAAKALVKYRIMTEGGNFYAVRPLQAMGIDLDKGVLRLSFVHYTTPAEVAQLIDALDRVL